LSKFKTSSTEQKYGSFTGKLKVLAQEDEFLFKVQLYLLNSAINRNNWQYLNLEKHRHLFENTPILVAYVNNGHTVGSGHNFEMKTDREGNEYASFTAPDAERIVGWFPDESKVRVENISGVDWIVGEAKIWAWYSKELVDVLKSAQGTDGMDISIETLITDMHMEGNTEVYDSYKILGTTILGRGVTPAVAGANVKALSVSDSLEKLKLRVAAYELDKKSQEKSTKKGVKQLMNRKKKAEIQAQFPDYRVLEATEDGLKIILLSKKDGMAYKYEFVDGETTIVAERIKPCAAITTFKINEDEAVEVDVAEVNEAVSAELEKANEDKETAEKENKALQEKMDAMEAKEKKRRVMEAKSMVRTEFTKFNEDMDEDEKVDEAVCKEIEDKADNGEFTECENKDGDWCGAEKACEELLAKCAKSLSVAKSKKASKNNSTFAWDNFKKNSSNKTGIEGLIERVNKKGVK
jgi:hypothetical protein